MQSSGASKEEAHSLRLKRAIASMLHGFSSVLQVASPPDGDVYTQMMVGHVMIV